MLQYIDPNSHFRSLIDAVSHQIAHTSLSDWEIADNCHTSTEFVRRQRKFLLLGPYTYLMKGEDEMGRRYEISKDDLHREYVENKKSARECAEIFGCSNGLILTRLTEYGIPKRPRGGDTRGKSQTSGENTNGTPPDADGVEIRTLHPKTKQPTDEEKQIIYAAHGSEETASEPETLKEHPEVAKPSTRHLERLVLLSAVKGTSIQQLLEESLELLFEKYG